MLLNTVLSFQTMSRWMALPTSFVFSYIKKCLTDNTLEKCQLVTLHHDDQTVENFEIYQEEWLTSLPPDNSFVSQKEWMTNVMCKPYTMKVK